MANRRELIYGSQGSDVTDLQNALLSKGYKLSVDGIFGQETDMVLRQFQRDNGLDADGIAGVNTYGVLYGGGTTTASTPSVNTAGTSKSENNPYTDKDLSIYDGGYKPTDSQITAEGKKTDAENALAGLGNFEDLMKNDPNSIWNQYLNWQKNGFKFDLNGDALYQQYKDKYIKQGQMAMMDTMGQAAAMNGGYGSSYAQMAGQQAYQASLENLNDIVPELYQMAYDKHRDKGQDMLNQYAIEKGMYDDKYGRLKDDRDYWTGRADTEYSKGYGEWNDNRTYDSNQYWQETNFGYGKERDEIADAQWQKEYDLKARELGGGGSSGDSSGGSSGGGAKYDNGSVAPTNIRKMQTALGIAVDGKWGAESKKAAGGLSADEAWKAYQNGTLKTDAKNDTSSKEYYADWDAMDWNTFFAQLRQTKGRAYAEQTLNYYTQQGLIPKNMVSYATSGARGGQMGH